MSLAFDPVQWVSDGGLLVEILLPRTDAGVLVQVVVLAVLAAVLVLPARRAGVLPLWCGVVVFTAGLLVMRGAH